MHFIDVLIVCLAAVLAVIWGASKLKKLLRGQVTCVSPHDAFQRIDGGEEIVVVDIRNDKDFNNFLGHIVHSINIPFLLLRERIERSGSNLLEFIDIPVLVVDNSESMQAFKACKIFKDFGFKRVELLDGGIIRWVKENLPTTR